ncbi:uncharacterized protein METZ01_LOCUS433542, partial [marine metagenome]
MRKYFSANEISAIFNISKSYVYKMSKTDRVRKKKLDNLSYFNLSDSEKYLFRGNNKFNVRDKKFRLLFINISLRRDAKLKILPVGLAAIMAYVDEAGYEFDVFDIDINSFDDDVIELFIKNNKYDLIAYGSIVTHYKWMKWLTNTIKKYHPETHTVVGNSVGGSCYEVFMKNC